MKKYVIVKIDLAKPGKQIMLYPFIEGDKIYDFETQEEAMQALPELINMEIYKNYLLEIYNRPEIIAQNSTEV